MTGTLRREKEKKRRERNCFACFLFKVATILGFIFLCETPGTLISTGMINAVHSSWFLSGWDNAMFMTGGFCLISALLAVIVDCGQICVHLRILCGCACDCNSEDKKERVLNTMLESVSGLGRESSSTNLNKDGGSNEKTALNGKGGKNARRVKSYEAVQV